MQAAADVVKTNVKANKITPDAMLIRFACEEVNLDFDKGGPAVAALFDVDLGAPAPPVDLSDVGDKMGVDGQTPYKAPTEDVEDVFPMELNEELKALAKAFPDGTSEGALRNLQLLDGDAAVYRANLAAYKYLLRWPNGAKLGNVRKRARTAYNEEALGDDKIGRWTHVADAENLSRALFEWDGKDADTTVTLVAYDVVEEPDTEPEDRVEEPAPSVMKKEEYAVAAGLKAPRAASTR